MSVHLLATRRFKALVEYIMEKRERKVVVEGVEAAVVVDEEVEAADVEVADEVEGGNESAILS